MTVQSATSRSVTAGIAAPEHPLIRTEPVQRAPAEQSDGQWHRACKVDDLEPSWGEAALVRSRQIALFLLSDGEIYAVSHSDPHTKSNVMARGIVGSRGNRPTIASPLHKEVYDLVTGECFTNSDLALETFRTRVVGEYLEVEVAE